jgi:flagellar biosynthesis/type III secretory pathway protein FliH
MPIKKNDSANFDVQKYDFHHFSEDDVGVKNFDFKNIESVRPLKEIEKKSAAEFQESLRSGFEIGEIVRKHRGIDQYKKDLIEREVNEKIEVLSHETKKTAYDEGFAKGMEDARKQFNEENHQVKIDSSLVIENFLKIITEQRQDILNKFEKEIVDCVKIVSKWVLNEESKKADFAPKIVRSLLNSVDFSRDLVITLDEKSYVDFNVEDFSELATIKNFKLEKNSKLPTPSIKVETNNTILDASLDKVFNIIDAIIEESYGE